MDQPPALSTRGLAELIAQTPLFAIPDSALLAARDAVIDTLAGAVAGAAEEPARIAARHAAQSPCPSGAPIWGRSIHTNPAEAAFANATSGHALDFDDSLPSMRGHPSVPLCAAGLAVAAEAEITGAEFLGAFVLAVELAGKLGRALGRNHYMAGWHTSATIGAFSSAAIAGRLMGLDAETLCHAFGLAASKAAGLTRNFGTMAKPLQLGFAARAGYMAAWLAREGASAATDILEGPGGFLAAYGTPGFSADIAPPGEPWEILDPGIYAKRWPCCYSNHRPLAGLFLLAKDHSLATEAVDSILVGFLPDADKALIHTDPKTGLEAKFSIEYCAAAALIDGEITQESFAETALSRPDVQSLMRRVRRIPMPGEGSFSGVTGYTDVTIIMKNGRRLQTRVEATPGSPEAPLDAAERRRKFQECTIPCLGEPASNLLLESLEQLPRCPDLARITQLLVPPIDHRETL